MPQYYPHYGAPQVNYGRPPPGGQGMWASGQPSYGAPGVMPQWAPPAQQMGYYGGMQMQQPPMPPPPQQPAPPPQHAQPQPPPAPQPGACCRQGTGSQL